jgi:hypothetical protein
MRYLVLLLFLLVNSESFATTYYPEFISVTNYPELNLVDSKCTKYPDFESRKIPQVRVYVNSVNQFNELSKFSDCVPQLDFIITLSIPDWVKSYPTFHWKGDDDEYYYTDEDLEGFTKKFTDTNPSFSERVKFDYVEAYELGYPIRSGYWSVGSNWNPTREEVIYHLKYNPNHSVKFKNKYLGDKTLAELQSMHSDHHEGRLKTEYLNKTKPKIKVREVSKKEEVITTPQRQTLSIFNTGRRVARSSCPNGRCPR